ncbi:MAG: hypothetical protein HY515_01180 [Candidatus Aenigmarchaeota archaeon]|nr:hypothetical protein [Candidatus Aenigmarchaeota archaeon]
MSDGGLDYTRQRIRELAYSSMATTGRVRLREISNLVRIGYDSGAVSRTLASMAAENNWFKVTDRHGVRYEIRTGNETSDALIRAGAPGLPGKEFGQLMDAVDGVERNEDIHPSELQTPTARCMLQGAVRHLARAAYDLRRTYTSVNADFSSAHSINYSIKRLEGGMERWKKKYGDDLIMTDTSADCVGVSVVGEDYIAKVFGIRKQEAVGAIRAMAKIPSMKGRVLLTNEPIPPATFVIVDCQPPLLDADPLFNMKFHLPMHVVRNSVNGARKSLIAELANTT